MENPDTHQSQDLQALLQLVEDIQGQLGLLRQKISTLGPIDEQWAAKQRAQEVGSEGGSRYGTVVEGVFDGQHMVGPDGKNYTIPANYASKSKLVEGDILKLTIGHDGSFIYKQIGPVERKHQQGTLVFDETSGGWKVVVPGGRSWRLLTASVTYYKGQPGDTVIALTPEHMTSSWAAVETVLPADHDQTSIDDWLSSNELYGGLDETDVINGEALLEDGSAGELPPPAAELDGEHSELPAPSAELSGEHSELASPEDDATAVPTTTSTSSAAYYADGSKPFIAPSV
jgi:hypothetical protein